MACDTQRLTPEQTLSQRKTQIGEAMAQLEKLVLKRKAKVVVDRATGAIAFTGDEWAAIKSGSAITDACAYRRIMATGSSLAKAEIARAEQMAGRSVDRKVLAAGIHSHDGGRTWGGH